MADVVFENKKINFDQLVPFGFELNDDQYQYQTTIMDHQFTLTVTIATSGRMTTRLMDTATDEEYVLHLSAQASGEFVGQVSAAYQDVLQRIEAACFTDDVFATEQARALIQFVQRTYADELEFLWPKFPKNAVWRRKDNRKWYGALLTVAKNKLGLTGDELVTVIDLRETPDEVAELVDGERYFPGYHMNKRNWYSIVLDDTVSTDEICRRLQASYELVKA
ncbi:MmcQ/YjbR family DNA-binding protein [Lactiplantibacillus herbarum]|uniref:MmcQ/YjbR family DNA-binding protein n=1 Tax=Lactiplantibacillus herbarum TaxID=1670446 RepID=UPI00064EE1D7|nr:MmcQ/YjbR family DNA-binding protein [Lactiplantibacillus herbarum]